MAGMQNPNSVLVRINSDRAILDGAKGHLPMIRYQLSAGARQGNTTHAYHFDASDIQPMGVADWTQFTLAALVTTLNNRYNFDITTITWDGDDCFVSQNRMPSFHNPATSEEDFRFQLGLTGFDMMVGQALGIMGNAAMAQTNTPMAQSTSGTPMAAGRKPPPFNPMTRATGSACQILHEANADYAGFVDDSKTQPLLSSQRINRVPGDAKVSTKWKAVFRWSDRHMQQCPPHLRQNYQLQVPTPSEEKEYYQVLSQVYYYMWINKSRYGYVITDQELLCITRPPPNEDAYYGRIAVSEPIPLSGRGLNSRLTAIAALVLLHMLAAGEDQTTYDPQRGAIVRPADWKAPQADDGTGRPEVPLKPSKVQHAVGARKRG